MNGSSGHTAALSTVGVPGAAQMVVGAASAGRYVAVLWCRDEQYNPQYSYLCLKRLTLNYTMKIDKYSSQMNSSGIFIRIFF